MHQYVGVSRELCVSFSVHIYISCIRVYSVKWEVVGHEESTRPGVMLHPECCSRVLFPSVVLLGRLFDDDLQRASVATSATSEQGQQGEPSRRCRTDRWRWVRLNRLRGAMLRCPRSRPPCAEETGERGDLHPAVFELCSICIRCKVERSTGGTCSVGQRFRV